MISATLLSFATAAILLATVPVLLVKETDCLIFGVIYACDSLSESLEPGLFFYVNFRQTFLLYFF